MKQYGREEEERNEEVGNEMQLELKRGINHSPDHILAKTGNNICRKGLPFLLSIYILIPINVVSLNIVKC